MLLLSHLLLGVRTDELLDHHEATADTDDQPSVEHFREDLPRSEHVETVAQALDGHRTASLVNVVAEEFVEHVTSLAREQLGRLLQFAQLRDLVLQEIYLLVADVELGLHLCQVLLSRLNQLVELVDMLGEYVFFVLQVSDIALVPVAILLQVVDLLVKIYELAILVESLHL